MEQSISDTVSSSPGETGLWGLNNPTGTRGLMGVDKVGGAVRFFNPVDFSEVKVLDLPNHHELAIAPGHRRAYVTDFGKFRAGRFVESGHHITVIDLDQMEMVGRIETGTHKAPHGMRFDASGNLWVIFEETGELGRIDIVAQSLEETFDIGAAGKRPPFIEITGDGDKIYVSSKLGDLLAFDIAKRAVTSRINVPAGTEGITSSPDGSRIVVAENSQQKLYVIDPRADRITSTIELKGAVLSSPKRSRLIRLRFTSDGRFLVSTNYASGVIHIHDGENLAEQIMLPVAKGPQGIAITADDQCAVIANHDSSSATLIDLSAARAIDWFEAGKGLETLTFF